MRLLPLLRRLLLRPGRPSPLRPGPLRARAAVALAAPLLLAGCVDHYVLHPRTTPPGVTEWSEQLESDGLRVRVAGARPAGDGPFAAVLVHPEAGHPASEMRGVLRSLAAHGYLAVAADYKREGPGGELFAWRREEDPRLLLERVQARPDVDPRRIAGLGFSQGGVYSLLIAAATGELAAVVAYYPVTDFERWLTAPRRSAGRRFVFRRFIGPYFRRAAGADSDEELSRFLARASPYRQAEAIRAPVLLVHGDRDRSADLSESRRLAERLRALDREVRLVVVEDAGHVFNFRSAPKAAAAWTETLAWLDRHLAPD